MNSKMKIEETIGIVTEDKNNNLPARGGRVVEANTIYEIDENCIECLKKVTNQ